MSAQPNRASRVAIPMSQVKLIFTLSYGLCAYPGCARRTVLAATDSDPASVIGEIAHIHSYEDDGPRANKALSITERNQYANLVLFCPTHHTIVDKQANTFTADMLKEWKRTLEKRMVAATVEIMPQVHFTELEIVTRGLLATLGSQSGDYTVIPPQEKMDKNGLSNATRDFMVVALARANVVGQFVDQFSRVDASFAPRLRSGFVSKYTELSAAGCDGDEVFEEMLSFATSAKTDLKSRAAGLAVLGYFFEACEVFKK